jgi:hypothetical protein
MSDNVIEIRNNITSSIIRFEALEEERRKREEEERKARWAREEEERKRIREEWQTKHPNMEKYTYCSAYNFETFNYEYGGYCKIHFYEWSNINSEPIIFNHYPYLYKFLDDCGIILNLNDNTLIRAASMCFITCVPGKKDLIVDTNYDSFREKFEEAKKATQLVEILSAVPDVS